ncbi:MAG: T9SS type A sorting domain-containing protein [Saprospiraceae bacterium]
MQNITTLFIALICLFATTITAQDEYYVSGGNNNYFRTSCHGYFYDSGGQWGNYNHNEDYYFTICPDDPNQKVSINFTDFELETNYDYLYVYDEYRNSAVTSWNRPSSHHLVGSYTGNNSPGRITSTRGCLTFRFKSDDSVWKRGWKAQIGCVSDRCSDVVDVQCNSEYWGNTYRGYHSMGSYSCSEINQYYFAGKEILHRFTLTERSDVRITLTNLYADLDLFLLNSCDTRTCLGTSYNWGSSNEVINQQDLAPGTYYVVVDAQYQSTTSAYKLKINCEPINNGCQNAIYFEDFDNYYNGNISHQSTRWAKVSNNFLDGQIVSHKYYSDYKSLRLDYTSHGEPNVVLKLGNRTWGKYRLNWKMYINYNHGAHFSLMNSQDWPSYPAPFERAVHRYETHLQGRWVDVELFLDLDNNQLKLFMNEQLLAVRDYYSNLGSLNFYGLPGYNDAHGNWVWLDSDFYVDDICVQQIYWFPAEEMEETEALSSNDNSENVVPEVTISDEVEMETSEEDLELTITEEEENTLITPELKVFPNPAREQATLQVVLPQSEQVTLQIYNQLGQAVKTIPLGEVDFIDEQLDISDLTNGVYLLRVVGETTQITRQLIVKN